MNKLKKLTSIIFLLALTTGQILAEPNQRSQQIQNILVPLCDPAKLATLSERGANPRILKIVFWLKKARESQIDPKQLMANVMSQIGWNDTKGQITSEAMLRNLEIADQLGCTDLDGMLNLRRGKAPIIRNGPYTGDQLSVDHIIPKVVHPELDCVLANLEVMPLRQNIQKSASMGERQQTLLFQFTEAGLYQKN